MKRISLFLLRISLGWLLFYAGITKVVNPEWSSAGYLEGATTFTSFYQWLASPEIIPIVNFLNVWGLTFVGVSLLLGIGVRLSGVLGALLMILYYFPVLEFPYIGQHAYLVDEHIIYALALLVLAKSNVGRFWGLEGRIPFLSKFF